MAGEPIKRGRVTDVSFRNGNKNGRDWEMTNFCLHEPKTFNGETKEVSWYMTAFSKLDLREGEWYTVGWDVRSRKDESTGKWGLEMYALYAVPVVPYISDVVNEARASQSRNVAAAQYQNVQAARQTPQTSPMPPRGPESFREDDIPF